MAEMDLAFVNRMAGITRGGAEIWDLKIAEGLEELGCDITFYVGKPLRSELPEPITGFETVEIPTPHLKDLAYAAPLGVGGVLSDIDSTVFCRRVARELKKQHHDLVQICSRPGFAPYVDTINAPVSVVMHAEPYSLWYDVVNPWNSTYDLLEAFDQVITVGGAREAIEKRVTCAVETVNPGVETAVFTPGAGEASEQKRVLFVGRFVPAKNLELLVEAFDAVSDEHPEAELVLVGDGPKRSAIEHEVDRRGLNERVEFTGYVPNESLPDLYRNATLFVLSSKSEGHPITLLEAMSCGTPVVAPQVGAIPKIIDDNKNGVLYPADSAKHLSAAISELLSDPEQRKAYSQEARNKAINVFDWSKQQTRLFQLYSTLIGDPEKTSKPHETNLTTERTR